jgi:hypothetical protein
MYVGTCYIHSQSVTYINQDSQAIIAMVYINQHVPKCINTFFINMFITNLQFTIQMAPTWSGVYNASANTREHI